MSMWTFMHASSITKRPSILNDKHPRGNKTGWTRYTLNSKFVLESEVVVRVDNQMSEEISILRGVCQGCVLSCSTYNSERIFKEVLEERTKGIINEVVINNIRYADDMVILATSIEDLI